MINILKIEVPSKLTELILCQSEIVGLIGS